MRFCAMRETMYSLFHRKSARSATWLGLGLGLGLEVRGMGLRPGVGMGGWGGGYQG